MNLYRFIQAERAQQRTVKWACQLLEVSRAAYYAHRGEELTERIRQAHQASQGRYGAPASTRSCGEAATGTPESGWPG